MSEDALKLTTYFGERSRVGGRLLADELLDLYARHEIRASILLRGAQGFGAKHHRRGDRLLTLSENLPLVSVAVDARERVESLMGEQRAIGAQSLMTLERARLGGGALSAHERTDIAADALKLTVYLGRHERMNGSPAFAAVCQTLHDSGVSGATVLLGVDGTRHGERLRASFFARNESVPLMVVSVGEPDAIAVAVEQLAATLEKPLFTIERARVCKRDGVLLQAPHEHPATGRGEHVRQKLTIVTSEAAQHEGRPVYSELVKRLRGARAAGATSLRGIWGFHGDHAPHGDRLLAIRRHVPTLTVTIDTPERIATLFPIVDELTQERGLVTSELVPNSAPLNAIPPL